MKLPFLSHQKVCTVPFDRVIFVPCPAGTVITIPNKVTVNPVIVAADGNAKIVTESVKVLACPVRLVPVAWNTYVPGINPFTQ